MFNSSMAQTSMNMLIWMRSTIPQETNTTEITILQLVFNKSNQMLAFDERKKPEYPGGNRVENQQTESKHDV